MKASDPMRRNNQTRDEEALAILACIGLGVLAAIAVVLAAAKSERNREIHGDPVEEIARQFGLEAPYGAFAGEEVTR